LKLPRHPTPAALWNPLLLPLPLLLLVLVLLVLLPLLGTL
jgi:hypothetical protein